MASLEQSILGSLDVFFLSHPGGQDGRLKGTTERVSHAPWVLDLGQLVDSTQVLAGHFLRLTTRQECNSRNSWWNRSAECSDSEVCNFLWSSLNFCLGSRGDHVWFKQHTFKQDSLADTLIHHSIENFLGDTRTFLDIMGSIRQDFRLDNWDKTSMLANLSISRKRMRSLGNGYIRRASIISDLENSSPLGKSCSQSVVLRCSLGKAIQTIGNCFIIGSFND